MSSLDLDTFEAHVSAFAVDNDLDAAGPLRSFLFEHGDKLVEMLRHVDEREHDMHMRIRLGYDKTVADFWRAKVAEVETERDALRAENARLRGALKGAVCLLELVGPDTDDVHAAVVEHARRALSGKGG